MEITTPTPSHVPLGPPLGGPTLQVQRPLAAPQVATKVAIVNTSRFCVPVAEII